jgi:caa(3)-type oxidase subunit IV
MPDKVAAVQPHGASAGHSEANHPKPAEYVRIAIVLAIITAAEVGVFYDASLRGAIVPILLVLSATKFVLVAMFFMHLKFDNRFFSMVFSGPLLLAFAVMVALLSLFHRVLLGV